MASQVIVSLLDDIDGKEAAGTTTFALDGVTYEIDLSEANRAKLDKALAPFMEHGRKVRGTPARRAQRGSASTGPSESQQIRAWAKSVNVLVPDRGRIPEAVREQYAAANG